MSVRAVLFDLDGTLIDSLPAHIIAWGKILREVGIDLDPHYIRLHEGEKAEETVFRLAEEHGLTLSRTELLELIDRKRALYRTMAPKGLIPAARRLIDKLHERSIECDIVTGSARSNLNGVVSAEELVLFTHVICADNYDRGKPAPDPYLQAVELSGFQKSECLVLENAPLGIQSSLAAGLRTLAVTTTLSQKDLDIVGCTVIANYDDLLEFV
jgi:beta-phosphoglucomutase